MVPHHIRYNEYDSAGVHKRFQKMRDIKTAIYAPPLPFLAQIHLFSRK
jgi:hypothetical protein